VIDSSVALAIIGLQRVGKLRPLLVGRRRPEEPTAETEAA
jgi:hypothetical protein